MSQKDKPRHGGVASTLKSQRNGAVGFIDWLDGCSRYGEMLLACWVSAADRFG
jgi:hypothetical protein